MFASQRKQQILQILTEKKQMMSEELSQRFNVSEDSIRRDLRELVAGGKLQRVHGGALPVSAAIAPIETHRSMQIASKQAVTHATAALVQPRQVVIAGGSTATAAMIDFLPAELNCTVVTHSPGIAVTLVDHPRIEVILLGDKVFKHSVVAMGTETLAGMARIDADLFFVGVTSTHPRIGFITDDYEEAGIKCALAARMAEIMVMVSQEKLNTASAFAISELDLASMLVIDGEPDAALHQQLVQCGVEIIPVQRQHRQGVGLSYRRTSDVAAGRAGSMGCP